jgi:ATP-dependent RNA helicase MSS116
MAWAAWLGFYNSCTKKLGISKEQLVVRSSEYATVLGLSQIPALPKKTIGKMGLQVRDEYDDDVDDDDDDRD